jgi:hypothetical protein
MSWIGVYLIVNAADEAASSFISVGANALPREAISLAHAPHPTVAVLTASICRGWLASYMASEMRGDARGQAVMRRDPGINSTCDTPKPPCPVGVCYVILVSATWIGWYSADSCRARLDDACGIHSTVLT